MKLITCLAIAGLLVGCKDKPVEGPSVEVLQSQYLTTFASAKGKPEFEREGDWVKLSFKDKERTPDVWVGAQARVNLDLSKKYNVSFEIKFDNEDSLLFIASDMRWNQRKYISAKNWKEREMTILVENGQGPITFVLESPGTVWIKDLKIEEVK